MKHLQSTKVKTGLKSGDLRETNQTTIQAFHLHLHKDLRFKSIDLFFGAGFGARCPAFLDGTRLNGQLACSELFF